MISQKPARLAMQSLLKKLCLLFAPVLLSFVLLGSKSVLTLDRCRRRTWAAGRYFQKKIGGITGDCLGAANQLIELGCYLSLVMEPPTLQLRFVLPSYRPEGQEA